MKYNNWILQHDNVDIYTAKLIKNCYKKQKINYINWPVLSPELNIIENVWGYLSRQVYMNNRQFSHQENLVNTIETKWEKIPQSYLDTLYKSILNRIFQVINKNGGHTKY